MLWIVIDDVIDDLLVCSVLLNEPFSWGYTPSPVIYPKMDLVCANVPNPDIGVLNLRSP
jgi:hypothetical protein